LYAVRVERNEVEAKHERPPDQYAWSQHFDSALVYAATGL
jgi:hypothetical protein